MGQMDWDHVRVFLTVAREGQILAAGRKLGLNHATVARRLDALEETLGTRLFDRRPAGSVLTPAGERLLPAAERVETDLLGIADATRRAGAAISGIVRIGAPDGVGSLLLAPELGRFAGTHPDLIIELVPLPRSFSISKREADLAIGLDVPREGRLTVSRLGEYTLGVYAARSYAAAYGLPARLDDLGDHLLVTGVEDYAYAPSLDYAHMLEARARRLFRCAGVVGQLEAVKAGVGIGVLHDFAVSGLSDLVRIIPEVSFRRSYHLFAHPDTRRLARIAACHDFLVRVFRDRRGDLIASGSA